ncbi:Tyrocidine synthase 3 [Paenibacillus plantiphilus]|uniref:Tyrocidine synthase 3 n=1 Tax=Paenibacillus plantiphilus TaxID=2905650 RepID=A0ABM9C2B3_9BACL|nr:Tyrocidine synthase 3 [Paenibacillus plantiphilus]
MEKLDVARDMSRNPLFDTMFVLQNLERRESELEGLRLSPYAAGNGVAKFDLTLTAAEGTAGLSFTLEYSTALYEQETMERLAGHFSRLLEQLATNPDMKLADIELLDEAEKTQLLERFNDTGASYPSDRTIHSLFEEQVRRTPDHVAVVHEEDRLTYAELNARANRLAHTLREQGVGPDEIVGLMMERSVDMIVGILGILKAGGAYLPIDPDYPAERISFMLENSGTKWLVLHPAISEQPVFWGTYIRLDEVELAGRDGSNSELPGSNPELAGRDYLNPEWVNGPSDLAYVIYTSGTTGTPKGTLIEHRNVVRLLLNDRQPFAFGEGDVWTLFHSYCFDFSVWEMYGALLHGGRLIVVPKETVRDPAAFAKLLVETGTTVLNQTPAAFYALAEREAENGKELALRYVIFGGEALKPVMLKGFHERYPETKLVNMYGITETTVHVTYKEITEVEIERNASSIGKPIPTLTAYILDSQRRLVPVGVTGELYVGGEGVCRGYLNRPELTAERFMENPYVPGERLYKTGDWARWLPNGEMEYYGRIDEQVKIRGYRIELGEIEAAILQEPSVREAAVMAKEDRDGSLYLCAYIVAATDKEGEVAAAGKEAEATAEVKASLQRKLPAYMVPSSFVVLEKLPLTPNGKLDRKALPEPVQGSTGLPYEAPITAMEAQLAQLWEDILGVERIGAADNFFERGGHSLRAMTLLSRMHKEWNVQVPLKTIFESPTVRGLAQAIQAIEGLAANPYAAIEPVEGRSSYYPVSPAQRRMLILQQLEGAEVSYNMPGVLMMEGPLDRSCLETAFARLVARHESLRTSFEWVDGEPVQRVHEAVPFTIFWESCSEGEVASRVEAFIRPFDLETAPLLRVGLLHLSENRHVLLYDMHHIISDGVSMGVLEQEFAALYRGDELRPLRIQYKDYAVWQAERLGAEELAKQEGYWQDVFSGELPVLAMPTDHARPAVRSFEGDHIGFTVEAELVERLRQVGTDQGATLYMVLLSAYTALLSKYTGQEDIVVGTPVAGRLHADLEQMIGMFVGTLALRNHPSGEKRFAAFVEEVKQRVLQAFAHQDYPFEELVEKLDVARDMSRNPLFDTMFVLQNLERREAELEGLRLSPYATGNGVAKFDLTLTAEEGEAGLYFTLGYSTALYEPQTMERLAGHFIRLLEQLAANPDMKLADIELLDEAEKTQLLERFNDTRASYPSDRTIHSLFEEQVRKTPDHVAVVHEEDRLTYAELNARANRLAHTLREQGVGPDEIVGVMMERSVDMIVGILGILKAGGAYLPIDPDYPAERIQYMFEDSGIRVLLVEEGTSKLAAGFEGTVLLLDVMHLEGYPDTNPEIRSDADAEQLAYVIYTSGSTGQPKGVMVEHRGVANALQWRSEAYKLGEDDCILQLFSFAFDGFVTSFFSGIVSGASVVLLGANEAKHPMAIKQAIAKNGVTHFICVPSLYGAILDELTAEEARTLRVVTLAGERVPSNIVEKSLAVSGALELVNEYGPTENSVVTTFYRHMERAERPLIGKPVANQHVYIVDRVGKLQPLGVPGELCIGGVGLARGYLNQPELTTERFVANPFAPGERLYKTGDWARWLPDGNIEYLGRIDEQVKIRGYRIELGEIEAAILQEPSVREAAVIAKEDRDSILYLCAYIVAAAEATAEVKASLQRKLPAYMVPSAFVALEKLPLSANGKLDRKVLPEPEQGAAGVPYEVPITAMEAGLAKLWEDILGVERIGAADNFFDRGGHSLRAMTLLSRMHKEWNVQMPLKTIFESPTLRELAQAIEGLAENPYAAIEPVEDRAYYPVSPAQRRMLILQQLEGAEVSYNMPGVLTMEGTLDRSRLETAFAHLVERHESLRTSFEWVDGEPVQRVHGEVPFTISWESCSEGEVASRVEAFIRPFDLESAPLLRVGLLHLSEERHVLLYDMHHIISDGVSMGVLEQEFAALYRGDDLHPLRIQYKDYAVWQNERLGAEELAKQEDYWKDVFSGELPVLAMPADHPRPAIRRFEGDHIGFTVEAELVERLRQVGADQGATLYMVLLAAYTALLSKYTGQADIVVGTPVAGRPHADLEQMIGMFVGTLALRNYPSGEKRFAVFVEEVKQRVLQAFAHQDYPFEELVEKLDVARDMSRNPLFDTMFVLQNLERREAELEGLRLSPYAAGNRVAKFDLTLTAAEGTAGLSFTLEYSTALYEQETMERLAGHFSRLLEQLAANPDMKLADIELLDEPEKTQLLERFNDTRASYPSDRTIHSLFEEQVRKTPDHVAVVHEEDRLTYAELNARANRLAHTLREQGVGPDEIVGLMMERSVEMIVGILGILKAGGAYLPIDPDYPAERISFMLENSGTKWLVLHPAISEQPVFGGTLIRLDEAELAGRDSSNPELVNGARDLAYMIYTSGTTGTPKGTLIEHRNVVRLLVNDRQPFAFDEGDVWTLFHSYCFDFSVWEMYGALLHGGRLIVVPKETVRDPAAFAKLLVETGTTVLNQTPAAFYALAEREAEYGKELALRYVIFGGEALKPVMLKDFHERYPETKLVNMYGITETTVHVTYKEITADEIERNASSIGKPIPTLTAYILDSQRRLVPVGVTGELYVGGEGVCRGYLNRPELTAERFVENPYVPGERLYKTGDWARWLPDGEMEYYGRIDEQVKIRGYRIEIGEIEAAILQEPSIREAAVMAKEDRDGILYLCAYIVAATGKEGEVAARGKEAEATAEVKASLQRKLPAYMVPSFFVALEELPLTTNGKLDRKALPEPEQGSAVPFEEPATAMEAELAKLWEDILGVERIGAADNFFERGGHSLRAMTLLSRMHKEWNVQMPLKTIFESPTVRGLAQVIEGLAENPYAAIEPVEGRAYYPVSSAQRRMLILQQLEGAEVSYNIPGVLTMEGPLDRSRLETAFARLVERHESLRTSFEWVDGEPVQRIHEAVPFTISLESCSEEEVASQVEAFIRPFDLDRAPLLRVGLLRLSEERHVLLYDMHHIISDGVSMGVLEQEFAALYRGDELRSLRIQYKDYAVWQNERLGAEELAKQEEYWQDVFSGELPVLAMPTDHPRPAVRSFEGGHIGFTVEAELVERLRQVGADQGATLYMVLLSAYTALLSKYTGQADIVVGTPVAGRPHADLEQMIGMFVGTLALRNYPSGEKRFAAFVEEVKQRVLQAFAHQDYPFEELVEKLDLARDRSRNPLFDTMFVLQNLERREAELEGLLLSPYAAGNGVAKFDLTLTAAEGAAGLYFTLDYSTALYEQETMERLAGHFSRLLEQLAANPNMKLADIELLDEAEKAQLLERFNDTGASYPSDRTIHSLFEEQVWKTPDHVAVVHEEDRLTYAELNARANRLAHTLREQGVGPNEIVGLMMERSVEMIVGILGILKAGGAYLPIDPDYPAERISFMLENSGTKWLVIDRAISEQPVFAGTLIRLDEAELAGRDGSNSELPGSNPELAGRDSLNPEWVNGPSDLAYVIYTSGTTGTPKGTLIEHRNVVRLLLNDRQPFAFGEGDVWTLFHSYCFDFSVWEMYGALLHGGRLIVVPKETVRDPAAFAKLLVETGTTVLNQTPAAFYALAEREAENGKELALRYVIFGGEALKPVMLKGFHERYPETKLVNMYGITETTVHVTYKEITADEIERNASSIGKPIPTLTAYILDGERRLVPIGVTGELYVGGEGVCRGYLNRPELTAERFVENPYVPGERLYKTGDWARWLQNGEMEYYGRMDEQVKIRGYRIELGEIEAAILQEPSVREAAVMAKEDRDGSLYLCAYIVAATDKEGEAAAAGKEAEATAEVKASLQQKLPAYMVPSYFVSLEKLPLTVNGKLDRKALPEPVQGSTGVPYEAPSTAMEAELAKLWEDILGVERIGAADNFFDRGGHSLKAMKLISRIQKELFVQLPIKTIFKFPTLIELSREIEEMEKQEYRSIIPAEDREYYPVTPAQKRLYILHQFNPMDVSYNMPAAVEINGKLDGNRFAACIEQLSRRHEVLRTSFDWVHGEPVQRIHEHVPLEIDIIDMEEAEAKEAVKNFSRPFDLEKAPLIRASLFRIANDKHYFVYDMHHIISDGVSMELLIKEFSDLYNGKDLHPLSIQYKDYTVWLGEQYAMGMSDKQEAYWLDEFSGELPKLDIAADFPRPAIRSSEGDGLSFVIDESIVSELRRLTQETETTMFMILLAAYNVLLSKYSHQEDIVIGTPVSGRNHADLDHVIGMFVNTLPIRNYPAAGKRFIDFLEEVKGSALGAYEHHQYPLESLVEKLQLPMDQSRNPLFDAMFVLHNHIDSNDNEEYPEHELQFKPIEPDSSTAKFDLNLQALEYESQIAGRLEYSTSLFNKASAERMADDYIRILQLIAGDIHIELSKIQLAASKRELETVSFTDVEFNF